MAALIEHLARWLAGGGFVERKEEHAALGAEALLLARRMPSRGESFRRKHDPFTASLGAALQREKALEALLGEGAQGVKLGIGERLVFGGALNLHEAAIVRHDDVEIDIGGRIVGVVKIERGLAGADAHGHGGYLMDDGAGGDFAVPQQLGDGVVQRDHAAGDGRTARAAVRLQHVTVDRDRARSQLFHIYRGAQGAADEARNFRAARIEPSLLGFAFLALQGGGGEHGVFGSDPPATCVAQEGRHLFFDAGGAEHPRSAPLDQDGSGGMSGKVADNLDGAKLVRLFHFGRPFGSDG